MIQVKEPRGMTLTDFFCQLRPAKKTPERRARETAAEQKKKEILSTLLKKTIFQQRAPWIFDGASGAHKE